MSLIAKALVTAGSVASMAFGLWHFTVPKAWNWYSYFGVNATELVVAVRAINVFFSLCLVLFGVVNVLLIHGGRSNRYSLAVVIAATCVLWMTRVALQLVYPQGSTNPVLQYGMLSAFVAVSLCYLIALFIVVSGKVVA